MNLWASNSITTTVARKAEDKPTIQTLHAECCLFSQTHSMLQSPACAQHVSLYFWKQGSVLSPMLSRSASHTIRQASTPFKTPRAPQSSRLQSYLKHREHHHPAGPHSYQSNVSRMRSISRFTSESTLVACQDTLTSHSMVHLQAFQTKVNRPHKPALANLAARAARLLIC